MRFKLTIEYQGTRYSGWQVQKNARTVAGEILAAAGTVANRPATELYGSGRTDAGVHALAQVAHLDLETKLKPEALRFALNDHLPADIHVRALAPVSHRFHARRSAEARSYLYQIARRRTAFLKPFVWWIKDPLDFQVMRRAAALFEGMHDFRSFTQDDPDEKSTRVQMEAPQIADAGDLILLRIQGSHFVWKLVRRLVGVLAEVGRGSLSVEGAARFLVEDSETPARLTAPPSGLFLERVFYEGDARTWPLLPALDPMRDRALSASAGRARPGAPS
jgi:tRNA pseudouridine38-40 synthase